MLIRRYTPPTCTLEITAKRSPLARLWGKTLVDELRFELRFDDPRQIQEDPPVIRGDREQLDHLCDAVATYVQDFLLQSSAANLPLLATVPLGVDPSPSLETQSRGGNLPYLQAKGLLFHELALGQLAVENADGVVPLSATQLFDLAAALDDYSSEIDRLPSIRPTSVPIVPAWAKVAALLVVTAGLATAIARISQLPQTQLEVASSPEETDSLATAPVEPLPPLPEPSPLPQPDFPDELAGRAGVTPPPTVTAPPAPNAPFVVPGPPRPLNQSRPANPPPSPPEEDSQIAAISPPPVPVLPDLPAVTQESQPQQDSALEVAPLPDRLATIPSEPQVSREAPTSPAPSASSAPPAPPASSAPPAPSARPAPRPARPRAITRALERPEGGLESFDLPPTSAVPEDRLESEPVEPPRVSQVREYFQQRWQPPENLPAALEYRLHLAGDGSIERIVPLGETAGTYLDRLPIPQLGKPFVAPDPNFQSLKLDLILGSDGSVQTRQSVGDR